MHSFVSSAALQHLYAELNTRYFDNTLPPCEVKWSRQLTRAAGNIQVQRRVIKLSEPILVEAFRADSLFSREYSVCGVCCASSDEAVREILKHEMIHLWLHVQNLPSGHTAEFRAKARSLGQPRTRHEIALPTPKAGWIYSCIHCRSEFPRRRRYGRTVACARCCKQFNGGKFHERFRLRGRRVA